MARQVLQRLLSVPHPLAGVRSSTDEIWQPLAADERGAPAGSSSRLVDLRGRDAVAGAGESALWDLLLAGWPSPSFSHRVCGRRGAAAAMPPRPVVEMARVRDLM